MARAGERSSHFLGAGVGGLHPPTLSADGRRAPRVVCGSLAATAPGTGSPRARLAAGTGWRVPRRLNLQEDILIRSGLRQPSAAAGGRAGLLPAPLPRALAGRETEMVAAETGAPAPEHPRGAGAFEGFAASCQGQSNPSHARAVRAAGSRQPGARGWRWEYRAGRAGQAGVGQGPGLSAQSQRRPGAGARRLLGSREAGNRCWDPRLGPRERG